VTRFPFRAAWTKRSTNVVRTGCPFQSTVVDEEKFDPLTVSVNPFPPATTLDGDNELSAAAGFAGGDGDETALLSLPHPAKAPKA